MVWRASSRDMLTQTTMSKVMQKAVYSLGESIVALNESRVGDGMSLSDDINSPRS